MTQPAETKEPGNSSNTISNEVEAKYTAGFRLLDKFQNQWAQIHAKDQKIINKARKAFEKKHQVETSCARSIQAVDDFVDCYRSLSKINKQIETISNDLKFVESYFTPIQDLLIVLKNHKENVGAKQYVEDRERLCAEKIAEQKCLSDVRKARLNAEHLQRIEALELQQQAELDERRRILGEAFEEEKSRYLEKSKEK